MILPKLLQKILYEKWQSLRRYVSSRLLWSEYTKQFVKWGVSLGSWVLEKDINLLIKFPGEKVFKASTTITKATSCFHSNNRIQNIIFFNCLSFSNFKLIVYCWWEAIIWYLKNIFIDCSRSVVAYEFCLYSNNNALSSAFQQGCTLDILSTLSF